MRPRFQWALRSRTLALGERTLIMGVLNVTPDSFSDGGRCLGPAQAGAHARRMLDDGADIIDVGGESTRPGAPVAPSPDDGSERAVSEEEELRRVLPVIEAIRRDRPGTILSVDTYKSAVARAAVEAGAEIVNDVSGFRWDSQMASTVAELGCGAVLMHMRGRPEDWRKLPKVDDMVALVCRDLAAWTHDALAGGVARERIVLDPGFGFGKSFEENYPLLARFAEFHQLGFPLLAGTSRKSFIGRTLARDGKDALPGERLFGSLAAMTATILAGAHIVRVHDIRAAVQASKVTDAILAAQP